MLPNRFINVCGIIVATLLCQIEGQCLTKNDTPRNDVHPDLSSITNFGLQLFKEVFPYNSTTKNFFFSSYSIWDILTLAYFGSQGQTEQQLKKVLNLTDKIDTMQNYKHLKFWYELRANQTEYTFAVANRAYFDKAVKVRECMKRLLPNEVSSLDFAKSKESAVEINKFVAETTKHRITQIVEGGDLLNSRMALVNAAFFKGTWKSQFKRSNTKKEIFYATPENYYFVDMMHQKGKFRNGISEELGAYVLEMPYNGDKISMVILLPPFLAGEQGFNKMVERLNADLLHSTLESLWRGTVNISIPKFSLEETLGSELISALQKMGIRDIFDPVLSNLTLYSKDSHLSVGKIMHKAFVEVNEEGTEAAAATSLVEFRLARPLNPETFICNHPFLFVIFDNETKNILFLGAYKNPRA